MPITKPIYAFSICVDAIKAQKSDTNIFWHEWTPNIALQVLFCYLGLLFLMPLDWKILKIG